MLDLPVGAVPGGLGEGVAVRPRLPRILPRWLAAGARRLPALQATGPARARLLVSVPAKQRQSWEQHQQ